MTEHTNLIAGRSAFVSLLKDEGVTTLFGNPGTTELPIMYALTEHDDIQFMLGLQESIVVAMADGYARASGKLAACNVHVAPGLGNAMGALYTAHVSNTPLLITAGQQEQGHGLTEPLLYAPLVPVAEPFVKWAVEVTRLEDLPRIMRRAAKIATCAPMGPVFVSLPGDILNASAPLDLGHCTRVDNSVRPSDDALENLALKLLAAKRPLIMAGQEVMTSDALGEAARFAETLGASVVQQSVQAGTYFLPEHPLFLGSLSRSQPLVRAMLSDYDLIVSLGANFLQMSVWDSVDPMPPGIDVIAIGLRDAELAKNYPASTAIRADVKETLTALRPRLVRLGGEALQAKAAAALDAMKQNNWSTKRDSLLIDINSEPAGERITANQLMVSLVDRLVPNAVIVDEGLTTSRALLSLLPMRDTHAYFGNVSGGIGWGIAAAVGVQAALPERRVVAIIGDGSAMYSIQALWTAANQKLPVVFVVANNGGYQIIKQRLKLFHDSEQFIGMDFADPAIDCAGLARSFGVRAVTVSTREDFELAFSQAQIHAAPTLIEAMVAPVI